MKVKVMNELSWHSCNISNNWKYWGLAVYLPGFSILFSSLKPIHHSVPVFICFFQSNTYIFIISHNRQSICFFFKVKIGCDHSLAFSLCHYDNWIVWVRELLVKIESFGSNIKYTPKTLRAHLNSTIPSCDHYHDILFTRIF